MTRATCIATEEEPLQPPVKHFEYFVKDEFSKAGIDNELYKGAGTPRFRQHVNPLSRQHQTPASPPNWTATFTDPNRPLAIDIGCGYGRFALAIAHIMPMHNILGLEIRDVVIERSNTWAERLGLSRQVFFMSANATISLHSILCGECPYPGKIDLITIQFPDPHFKKRHRKRRTVQPSLVKNVAQLLSTGGRVFLQSDVQNVVEDMRNQFERHAGDSFRLADEHSDPSKVFYTASSIEQVEGEEEKEEAFHSVWAHGGWLTSNPLCVPTEREVLTLGLNLPVYRVLLVKQ